MSKDRSEDGILGKYYKFINLLWHKAKGEVVPFHLSLVDALLVDDLNLLENILKENGSSIDEAVVMQSKLKKFFVDVLLCGEHEHEDVLALWAVIALHLGFHRAAMKGVVGEEEPNEDMYGLFHKN